MKLLYCPNCQDIVKIFSVTKPRYCFCGESSGFYNDGIHKVVLCGNAVPIGIDSCDLRNAVDAQSIDYSRIFKAFVRPEAHEDFLYL